MDDLFVSRNPVVTFRSPRRDDSGDPFAGGSFTVELVAAGLQVRSTVFMFSFDWRALVDFFTDLAESWRGWEGRKEWHSSEHHLHISAVADALGHCTLSFVVRDSPVWTWSAQLEGVAVDSGEDLTNLARKVSTWAIGDDS